MLEHLGLEVYLKLLDEAAEIDDEGDAGDALQPVADRPIRDGPELKGVLGLPQDSELENLSHPRRDGTQMGPLGALRQIPRHDLELAGDDLPGQIDVGAPGELHRYDRAAGS